MEIVIALISLATAVIGLVATLAGKKQVIIVRDSADRPQVSEEWTTEAGEEIPPDKTVAPETETPRAPSTEPASVQPGRLHWYDKPGWLILSFILFWPIGLYGIAKSRAVKKSWKIATFGVLVPSIFVIIFASVTLGFRSSWAYLEAMELARNNPALIEELGEPLESSWFVSGSIRVSGPSGQAEILIPVEGPRKAATLYVVAIKQAGRWEFELAEAEIEGRKSRIDLIPDQR
jgi:hypothetical protein